MKTTRSQIKAEVQKLNAQAEQIANALVKSEIERSMARAMRFMNVDMFKGQIKK